MKKNFTKADLTFNMLVVTESGEKFVLYFDENLKSDKFFGVSDDGMWISMNSYNNNLEYDAEAVNCGMPKKNFNIKEVYSSPRYHYMYSTEDIFNVFDRDLLWKREEVKKMTVAEISEALGYEVEIVKG